MSKTTWGKIQLVFLWREIITVKRFENFPPAMSIKEFMKYSSLVADICVYSGYTIKCSLELWCAIISCVHEWLRNTKCSFSRLIQIFFFPPLPFQGLVGHSLILSVIITLPLAQKEVESFKSHSTLWAACEPEA